MMDMIPAISDIILPMSLGIAWIIGELGNRFLRIPRISSYGIVGFLLAQHPAGYLARTEDDTLLLLASTALGLVLFDLGRRVSFRWLRSNPWIGVTSLVEAGGTFSVVFALVYLWWEMPLLPSLLVAALAMSTSPAAVLRIANEQRAEGQVTVRALHLSAFSCLMAVFIFKALVGVWLFNDTGNLPHALGNSLVVLFISAVLGGLFGIVVPVFMRWMAKSEPDTAAAYAIAVVVLVTLTHAVMLSPLLSTLVFGMTARHNGVYLGRSESSFGALGSLLTIVLFVFVASTLEWQHVVSGAAGALVLVGVRFVTKIGGVLLFAEASGITLEKGFLTGMALTPISAFVILLLEQSRRFGFVLLDEVNVLAAMTLMLEVVGPIATVWAFFLAKEVASKEKD